jgi:signal transduction histidine kinase
MPPMPQSVGYIAFGYIADVIGRRPTILLYSVGTLVIGLYLFLGVSTYGPYPVLLLTYGFFVIGIFSGHAIYMSELFPTHVRSTAVAFCNGSGRIFTSFGPLVAGLLVVQLGGLSAEGAYRNLKAAQASLIQAEKMASLGQLTAGIAHEIKNPLNFVNNFAGLSVELLDELKENAASAISSLDDDKRAEIDETVEMLTGNLEKIAEHGRRADNIVKSMLEHSRGTSGERRSVDLNGLIEEALNLAYHGGRAQDQSFNITLERDYAAGLDPIEIVPQDITRVCLNLFDNGFYAATKHQKEGGDPNFKPTLRASTRDLGDVVEVRIRDNGTGIPLEIKDKLFQPFFTTKPTGEGTGLGLSISYDIVTQQHGCVSASQRDPTRKPA